MIERSRLIRISTSLVGLVVITIVFVSLVHWQQRSQQADLLEMRASAPQAWLDEMRWRKGFASYLEAVRDLRHFDTWRADAPLFLIGRWAEEPAGRSDLRTSLEDHCRTGYVFEDNRLRRFGDAPFAASARYRIDDQGRIGIAADEQRWLLLPDPNGPALRHLRLQAPDGSEVDLLRCG